MTREQIIDVIKKEADMELRLMGVTKAFRKKAFNPLTKIQLYFAEQKYMHCYAELQTILIKIKES